MSEENYNEIGETILQAAEDLETAMMVGDYKKVTELLNFLEETKKAAEMAIEAKKDIMVA